MRTNFFFRHTRRRNVLFILFSSNNKPAECTNSEARGNISIHRVNFFAIRFDVQRTTFTMTTNKTKKNICQSLKCRWMTPFDIGVPMMEEKKVYVFLLNCNQFTSEIYYSFPLFLVVHILVANCHVKTWFSIDDAIFFICIKRFCLCRYYCIIWSSVVEYKHAGKQKQTMQWRMTSRQRLK